MPITSIKPQATAQSTTAVFEDNGLTYNEAGISYNEAGVTYGGGDPFKQFKGPTSAKITTIQTVNNLTRTL